MASRVTQFKTPGFGDRRKAMLQKIAVLTGRQVISEELGLKLEHVKIEQLGRARFATLANCTGYQFNASPLWAIEQTQIRKSRSMRF